MIRTLEPGRCPGPVIDPMIVTFNAQSRPGPLVGNYSLASLKAMPEKHSCPIFKIRNGFT